MDDIALLAVCFEPAITTLLTGTAQREKKKKSVFFTEIGFLEQTESERERFREKQWGHNLDRETNNE